MQASPRRTNGGLILSASIASPLRSPLFCCGGGDCCARCCWRPLPLVTPLRCRTEDAVLAPPAVAAAVEESADEGTVCSESTVRRAIPTSAAFKAPTSFVPSPHMNVGKPISFRNVETISAFSSGEVRAKTQAEDRTACFKATDELTMARQSPPTTHRSL